MKKRESIKVIVQRGQALRDALLVNAGGTPPPVVDAATDLLLSIGVGPVANGATPPGEGE